MRACFDSIIMRGIIRASTTACQPGYILVSTTAALNQLMPFADCQITFLDCLIPHFTVPIETPFSERDCSIRDLIESHYNTDKEESQNIMSKVTCGMSMSLDGFVAGPNQSEEKPFGDIPENLLHEWMFKPGEAEKHKEEIDYLVDADAFIMGRNMFGPRGEKYDQTWKGWWGPNPPYHAPVFVLTHIPREAFEMEGGTIFHFVTDGPESAFRQAKAAARDKNILIAGGANTVNQFLKAGILDEMWLHIAPVTIGVGARLFEGVSNLSLKPIKIGGTEMITHIKYQVLK